MTLALKKSDRYSALWSSADELNEGPLAQVLEVNVSRASYGMTGVFKQAALFAEAFSS